MDGKENNIIAILQMEKLNLRDTKSLPQGYATSKIAELEPEPGYCMSLQEKSMSSKHRMIFLKCQELVY